VNRHHPGSRTARLFRDGDHQAIALPAGFELPGTEATIRKDGERLIIEPASATAGEARPRLAELLDSWEPEPAFADVDDSGLPPLRDIYLA